MSRGAGGGEGATAERTPTGSPRCPWRGGVDAGGGARREEKKSAGECTLGKVLRDFGLSAGHSVVKAAASRRTPE